MKRSHALLACGNPQIAKTEGDSHLDDKRVASWIRQSSKLPGWVP